MYLLLAFWTAIKRQLRTFLDLSAIQPPNLHSAPTLSEADLSKVLSFTLNGERGKLKKLSLLFSVASEYVPFTKNDG